MAPEPDTRIRGAAKEGRLVQEIPADGVTAEVFEALAVGSHEQVVFGHDPDLGLRTIIAVHSTTLGPSLGGTRYYPFDTEAAALADVLRLSQAMSYKSAAAGLDLGGGKAVIIGDPDTDRSEALLRAYARFVDSLGGRYYTTEDVGTTVADMEIIREETPYVTGQAVENGGSGDPSPATAVGVYEAMRAAAAHRWGSADLAGRHVTVSGVGKVGSALVDHLLEAGAEVTAADVDRDALAALPEVVAVAPPEKAHAVECDIFAPCALGAVLNPTTIPELRCEIVAGSANNQLGTADDADRLREHDVLYVPDYVANAGGVINIAFEMGREYSWEDAEVAVRRIYQNTETVLAIAQERAITTAQAADRVAEERMHRKEKTGLPPLT